MKKVSIYSVLAGIELEQEFNELTNKGITLVTNRKRALFLAYCEYKGVNIAGGEIVGNGQYFYINL